MTLEMDCSTSTYCGASHYRSPIRLPVAALEGCISWNVLCPALVFALGRADYQCKLDAGINHLSLNKESSATIN